MDADNHLIQDFEVPEGALPVRAQVGDLPVTIVGWVASGDDLPQLFESLARELREMMGQDAAAPTD